MRFTITSSVALALSLGLTATSVGQQKQATLPRSLNDQIEEGLALRDWTLQEIFIPEIPLEGGFDATIQLDGFEYTMDMYPHSMRSDRFLLIEVENGQRNIVQPPPSETYKGDLVDREEGDVLGVVRAVSWDGKIDARIRFTATQEVWGVQPLSAVIPDYQGDLHVIYRADDIEEEQHSCGTDLIDHPPSDGDFNQDNTDVGDRICDIALDCDYAYFLWAGGNRKATLRNAEKLMLDVEDIYEDPANSVDITYEVTQIVVRKTSADDPYTSNDPSTLLNQFRTEWNNNYQQLERDVAHLMTGRNINGGVIGIAWLSVICDSLSNGNGYGLSETSFSNNSVSRAGLTAHELGHNWSAGHCDGDSDCGIMCSGLGGCTGNLVNFGGRSQGAIRNHRNSRNCLEIEAGPVPLPFFDDFELGDVDEDNWSYNNGAGVVKSARNEPSGEWSLRLNATGSDNFDQDDIRTGEMDFSAGDTGTVDFFIEFRGPEAGEILRVEYFTRGKSWKRMGKVVSDGTVETNFSPVSIPMPDNAFHTRFRLRLRPKVTDTNDNVFIDDISINNNAFLSYDDDNGPDRHGDASIKLRGGPPNAPVLFYGGFAGPKRRPFDPKRGMDLDLEGTPVLLGQAVTDAFGRATLVLSRQSAQALAGRAVDVQGVILKDGAKDGVELTPILRVR